MDAEKPTASVQVTEDEYRLLLAYRAVPDSEKQVARIFLGVVPKRQPCPPQISNVIKLRAKN